MSDCAGQRKNSRPNAGKRLRRRSLRRKSGTPVWNGRVSCPVNTVLAETDLSGKDPVFVLYSGSGEAPKTEERIAKEYPNASIIHLKEPKSRREELDKLGVL